jgi:hypothetical protein
MTINQEVLEHLHGHLTEYVHYVTLEKTKELFTKLFEFNNEQLENLFLTSIINIEEIHVFGTGDNQEEVSKEEMDDIFDDPDIQKIIEEKKLTKRFK